MDDDGVGGLLEDDAVAADAKTKQTLHFAGERSDAAHAGVGGAVDGFEDGHGDVLRNGTDFSRDTGAELNLLQSDSLLLPLVFSGDLLHGKATLGDGLLKGNTLAAIPEVLAGGMDLGDILREKGISFVLVVYHDFEQMNHGGELARVQLSDEFVCFGFECLNGHDVLLNGCRGAAWLWQLKNE